MNSLKQGPPWRGVVILLCICLTSKLWAQGFTLPALHVNNDLQQTRDFGAALGSSANPHLSIQTAINMAVPGQTVLVAPGEYTEPIGSDGFSVIKFHGKDVAVQSTDPNDPVVIGQTVIHSAVLFDGNESETAKISGFTFKFPVEAGIYGNMTKATISHCFIVANTTCDGMVLFECDGLIENCLIADNRSTGECFPYPVVYGCQGTLRNCTIANNSSGIAVGSATVENCIISGNQEFQLAVFLGDHATVSYSCINGGAEATHVEGILTWGRGNIDSDPHFVRLGMWIGQEYIPGDYHLMSQGLRWDDSLADDPIWVSDAITSLCTDAGDPGLALGQEVVTLDPFGSGVLNARINMGAYGGTYQASIAPQGFSIPADVLIPEIESSAAPIVSVRWLNLVNILGH